MLLSGSCDMMSWGQDEHEETICLNCDIKHGLWKNSLVAIVIVILVFCVKRKIKMQKRHPMAFVEAYISMIVRLWSAAQKMCVDCCARVVFFFCVSKHHSFFTSCHIFRSWAWKFTDFGFRKNGCTMAHVFQADEWQQLSPSGSAAARDSHSAVWSPTADGMYIFGGNSYSHHLRLSQIPQI